jgi:hypothetical protein
MSGSPDISLVALSHERFRTHSDAPVPLLFMVKSNPVATTAAVSALERFWTSAISAAKQRDLTA